MTAERGSAAGHDRAHHPLFDAAQMPGVSKAINIAMPAQDIRDLDVSPRPVPGHGRSIGWSDLQGQTIERALRRPDRMGRDLRV